MLRDLIGFVRAHHLHIPPELVLLIRSLVTIESVGRKLDPRFDIARHLAPFLRALAMRRFHPYRIISQTLRTTEDLQRIATLLPDLLSQSLDSIKRGGMKVHFDLEGFGRMVRQLTRASNTLAVGIVISGLFVASSVVFRAGPHPLAYYRLHPSGPSSACGWSGTCRASERTRRSSWRTRLIGSNVGRTPPAGASWPPACRRGRGSAPG